MRYLIVRMRDLQLDPRRLPCCGCHAHNFTLQTRANVPARHCLGSLGGVQAHVESIEHARDAWHAFYTSRSYTESWLVEHKKMQSQDDLHHA
jgi:hypothetical protein